MKMGIKFRIYPNKEQQKLIDKTFGSCRFVYNIGLTWRSEAYWKGCNMGYMQTSKELTNLKKQNEYAFLRDVDSVALQQSLRDLDNGFKRFFQKKSLYPKYKSKRSHYQSYRTINQNNRVRIVGRYIRLPKIGLVKLRQSREVGKICSVTVECTPTGKYFVALRCECEPISNRSKDGKIGIDVGIKEFYSDSNGNKVANKKYYERSLKKLVREQRKLSRKVSGSTNWDKQRIKVALIHEKVANQRKDFLQKKTTMLIRENQTICIEDLKIKNMLRNHRLARCISSASWGMFFEMLEYKADWNGNEIIKIPTMYPSSQTCSQCGYKNPIVKNLVIRMWQCPNCHSVHDRDINASINILNKGLQMQLGKA